MVNFIIDKLKNTGKTVFTAEDMYNVIGATDSSKKDKSLKLLCQLLLRELIKEGKVFRPRKNVYTLSKNSFSYEELGCVLYYKSYLSFETILEKSDLVKNKSKNIVFASYVSRKIKVGGKQLVFKELKENILNNRDGLENKKYLSAELERAFLDTVYLNPEVKNFKNLNKLDKTKILKLMPLYDNKKFEQRVKGFLF